MITRRNSDDHVDTAIVIRLKDCAKRKELLKGIKLHADILLWGLLSRNIFVGNTLIFMYAKCGALAKAQQVFDDLPIHTLVSWTALIAGFSQHGYGEKAIMMLNCMQQKGFSPDELTFACCLKACASLTAIEKGIQLHADSVRHGFLRSNVVLGSAFVDMYAKCGFLAKAQQVFDELPSRNIVSWNALITGYSLHGHGEHALRCFDCMHDDGFSPDGLTLAGVLKACGCIQHAAKGKEVHTEIARKGLLEADIVLGNALVDMYCKCGEIFKGQEVFDKLPARNIISWTALIIGYCKCKYEIFALLCFTRMKIEGFSPDAVTLACILQACGSMGAAALGEQIHGDAARTGLHDRVLGNVLVGMYSRCGALTKSRQVFDELLARDIDSWNALITRYCEHGKGNEALDCFEQLLQQEEPSPNAMTFAHILKACVIVGAFEKCKIIYAMMRGRYGIIPTADHHMCMLDLFGREGNFEQAITILKNPTLIGHLPAWLAFLDACGKYGNMKFGRLAFETVAKINPKAAAAYVCACRLYTNSSMLEHPDELDHLQLGLVV